MPRRITEKGEGAPTFMRWHRTPHRFSYVCWAQKRERILRTQNKIARQCCLFKNLDRISHTGPLGR